MSYQSHRYNAHGSWVAAPIRQASGPIDPALRNSPAVLAALTKIDRAFGGVANKAPT